MEISVLVRSLRLLVMMILIEFIIWCQRESLLVKLTWTKIQCNVRRKQNLYNQLKWIEFRENNLMVSFYEGFCVMTELCCWVCAFNYSKHPQTWEFALSKWHWRVYKPKFPNKKHRTLKTELIQNVNSFGWSFTVRALNGLWHKTFKFNWKL